MVLFRKCEPWSLINTHGQPNLVITFSKMNCDSISIVQYLIGATSTHLVRYSVGVMMEHARVQRIGGLMDPTKYISHLLNDVSTVTGNKGSSSLRQGFLIR
jgi:hypothetical protein